MSIMIRLSERSQYAVSTTVIERQRHALERMMERGISRKSVKEVLLNGE